MGDLNFWKILRVLTTNVCNYECSFCHNEGQGKNNQKISLLKFDDFKVIIDSLADSPLKEIHFSGGEPFMNPDTLKMIIYANDSTNLDLGCATNIALLNEQDIFHLSKTRVKLNIQFPAIENTEFERITKNGGLSNTLKQIDLLRKYNVKFGLNHVLKVNSQNSVKEIIKYISGKDLSIKLLPDLNNMNNSYLKDNIFAFLDSIATKRIEKGTGAFKWWINGLENTMATVMYVDSPCFYKNIKVCRNYAEIRLRPELKLQSCILKSEFIDLDFDICKENKHLIIDKFQKAWTNFISC